MARLLENIFRHLNLVGSRQSAVKNPRCEASPRNSQFSILNFPLKFGSTFLIPHSSFESGIFATPHSSLLTEKNPSPTRRDHAVKQWNKKPPKRVHTLH